MSLFIAGMGWVTPLGNDVKEVWTRLLLGEEAAAEYISDPVAETKYPAYRISDGALSDLPKHPRLRRVSNISRFAAAAGLAALENAKSTIGKIDMNRVALVFAVSNGGVNYTKRFYHDIVASGAQAASPLLFPETVFNAPASHLAAIVGIDGASYTLVGDGAIGVAGVALAQDLLAGEAVDYCLVVAAEEADWLLCDAYHRWRLLRSSPPIEIFSNRAKGMIPSEGAGAVFIARTGLIEIEKTNAGIYYGSRAEAAEMTKQVARALATPDTRIVISSANGTFVDAFEAAAISESLPRAMIYSAKPALGDSVGASALWQVIIGAQALHTGQIPPRLHAPADSRGQNIDSRRALVLSCGLNQQVAGLRLSI